MSDTTTSRIELVCACGRRHTVDAGPVTDAGVERHVSLAIAARTTGMSRWTLRRLALSGELAAVRGVRNAIMVLVSDVRRWLDSRPVERVAVDESPPGNLLDRALKRAGQRTRPVDGADLDDTG